MLLLNLKHKRHFDFTKLNNIPSFSAGIIIIMYRYCIKLISWKKIQWISYINCRSFFFFFLLLETNFGNKLRSCFQGIDFFSQKTKIIKDQK